MNSTQTATTTPAATAPATGLKAFNSLIQMPKTQTYLQEVLGEKKSQFVNNLVALVSNSENLQNCDPQSVMFAGIKATALNLPLDPNLGFAYIVPYNDKVKRKKTAQFQIGYRGLLQLAIRSGQMAAINVTDVRQGELVGEDILTGEIKLKKTANRTEKPVIGYVAYMRLVNGFEKTIYSSRDEVENFALRFSKQKFDGKLANVWASDFDAMAKKTVLKALLKYAPLSTEMAEAISHDEDAMKMQVENPAMEEAEAEVITVEAEDPTPAAETKPQQPQQAAETKTTAAPF